MRIEGNDAGAYTLSLLLHVAVLVVAWLSSQWAWREPPAPAAGEPIGASLELSSADLRKAQQAIEAAQKAGPPPPPQPEPEPRPQDAETPLQPTPQAPLERPDTVDQEQVVRNAIEPSAALAEQEARRRQEQVDLTEDLVRQQEAEERQRLRAQQEQLDAIRRERAEAAKLTRMEEQRLAQLADAARPTPPQPAQRPAPPSAGERGIDQGLKARYIAALNATARDNWNTGLAPELIRCDVRFTQIPGGEVINVEFMACPYDAQGRESVERALRRTPMPYSGFEPVFQPKVTLTFCYPEEACPQ